MIFLPMHTQWLAETPLVSMLLDRLAPQYSAHVQSNAADILTAIAHTQPSALATQLMQQSSLTALFSRALAPGSKVLVTALDVCAALLEPRRSQADASPPAPNGADGSSPLSASSGAGGRSGPHSDAIASMLQYIPQLMEHLKQPEDAQGAGDAAAEGSVGAAGQAAGVEVQETPYGVLAPPLGRARLRIVELLAALLRVGGDAADAAIIGARALPLVQALFLAYPFNNLLHHQMYALLVAALRRGSAVMTAHIFGECELVAWLAGLPEEVTPRARPGFEGKGPLRAGYLGHVTRIGQVLQEAAQQQQEVADALRDCAEWQSFVQQQLGPRLELEDVMHWQCGRPVSTEGGELDSDGDDFQVCCLKRCSVFSSRRLYHLFVAWQQLEVHMVGIQQWRAHTSCAHVTFVHAVLLQLVTAHVSYALHVSVLCPHLHIFICLCATHPVSACCFATLFYLLCTFLTE
jgi:serine/threonine-protein phosphatase 6 regulatory subunit 3